MLIVSSNETSKNFSIKLLHKILWNCLDRYYCYQWRHIWVSFYLALLVSLKHLWSDKDVVESNLFEPQFPLASSPPFFPKKAPSLKCFRKYYFNDHYRVSVVWLIIELRSNSWDSTIVASFGGGERFQHVPHESC